MSYGEWFTAHAAKHKKIVEKLLQQGFDTEQIIDYFDFESMVKNEPGFCPLYAEGRKCHEMEKLNCYLCACPNFRFSDEGVDKIEGKIRYSFCSIDSKEGRAGIYGEKIHQDCSKCSVPHHRNYVQKHFSLEWFEVMQACEVDKNGKR